MDTLDQIKAKLPTRNFGLTQISGIASGVYTLADHGFLPALAIGVSLTIWDSDSRDPLLAAANPEIVKIATSPAAGQYTFTRAQENTVEREIAVNDYVAWSVTVKFMKDLIDAMIAAATTVVASTTFVVRMAFSTDSVFTESEFLANPGSSVGTNEALISPTAAASGVPARAYMGFWFAGDPDITGIISVGRINFNWFLSSVGNKQALTVDNVAGHYYVSNNPQTILYQFNTNWRIETS